MAISTWIGDLGDVKPGDRKPRVFTIACKDGTQRIVQIIASVLSTGDYLMTCEDITELRKLENQLRQSQKMEAIGTLAAGIAHDFNNVLTGIIGFTEMVYEDLVSDSPEHKRLGLVLKGAHRGRDLVKQILTFSRQTEQDRKPLALAQTIEEGLKILRPLFPSTIQIMSRSLTNDDMTLADPVQIHQVLMNLCTNAAHAMRDNGGILDINVSKTSLLESDPRPVPEMEPGEYIVLEVRDTGCGMTSETLECMFDPFFTTKKQGEGTGLGLSVVHGILKSHGGHVAVESKPGKGTVFHIYFPKVKEYTVTEDKVVQATTGKNERILIIDDEDIIVELDKQRLSRLGYEVVATTSSVDALNIFRKEPDAFDLVITDQTMPHLTGMDLAVELLKIRATIPIILCTGHSETVSLERATEAGIRAFLMKPLTKEELAQTIRRVLDAKREE
jgi:signal transduction histidine kinase/CheY-like chemotaxis protein